MNSKNIGRSHQNLSQPAGPIAGVISNAATGPAALLPLARRELATTVPLPRGRFAKIAERPMDISLADFFPGTENAARPRDAKKNARRALARRKSAS